MQPDKFQTQDKAIVLGGGGITGIAWESGIIAGLISAGINLAEADTILGTSAGAFVGSALASGYNMEDYYAMQQQGNSEEPSISASLITRLLWIKAFVYGGKSKIKLGKASVALLKIIHQNYLLMSVCQLSDQGWWLRHFHPN